MGQNTSIFDEKYWEEVIQKPDWYLDLVPFLQEKEKSLRKDDEQLNKLRKLSRQFLEKALEEEKIVLAKSGPDLDKERMPIDTIVIHHTSHKPGYRLSYLNAVHLINIYAPYFINPTVKSEAALKGRPLWSGHFKDGKQVFWGYHWLLRMDGKAERLLDDKNIGWHAGDWEINRRSVAICLDNDYENMCPAGHTLRLLAAHIKAKYPQVKPENILGHCEVKKGTACPGVHFLEEWKPKLLEYLNG